MGAMGLPKIYDVVIDRTAFSPNGDDFRDTITLSFVGSEVLDWVLQVKAADGTVVRRKTGRGQSVSIHWAGLSDAGELVPDGPYRLVLSATSPLGTARASTTEVVVDTRPPVPSLCVLSSPFLSPNGDGYADRARLTYNCGERVYARVSILDEAGAVVRALTSWQKLGSTRVTTAWDGRIPVDGVLRRAPEGLYAFKLELRDPAGNTGVTTRAVTLDLTLGFFTATELSFSPNADGVKDETVVGFTLTRTVATRVTILLEDTVVRTLQLGELGVGTHSATWDGTDEEGLVAPSGVYKVRVEAESAIGYSRIGRRITLDRTKPRITAPLTATVTLGSTVRMRYVVADAWSPTVKVKVTIVRASDRVIVKKLYIGWVTSGETHVASWTPPARRKYIAVFRAIDEAGNRQAESVSCVITVL